MESQNTNVQNRASGHKSVLYTNIDFFESFKKLKLNQNIDKAFEGKSLEQELNVEKKCSEFRERFE